MKKILFLMMLLVASTSLTSFGQSLSSKDLLKERSKELKKVERENIPDDEREKKIEEINSFYKGLIEKAMDQEMATPSNNSSATSSTTNTNLPSKERKFGGDFSLPNIKGGSMNITKTADAYATAVMAEASAKYMEACANAINSNEKEEFPGLLKNEDYRNVIFTIRGPGGYPEITVQVSARGQEEITLPFRGAYTVTTQIIQAGKTPSPPVTVTVGNPYKYGLYGGKKYSFVLTQPLSN